jgi:hypothetical protein
LEISIIITIFVVIKINAMIKETLVDNNTTAQLEVWFTEKSTIRLYISDSEDPSNYYSSEYIDLDADDTDYLIKKLTELKQNFKKAK